MRVGCPLADVAGRVLRMCGRRGRDRDRDRDREQTGRYLRA